MAEPGNFGGSIALADYAALTAPTDVLGPELPPVLQGLYGEVGGIMATAKKHVREGAAFAGYRRAAIEEFGDALWYFAAICRRIGQSLDVLFTEALSRDEFTSICAASDLASGTLATIAVPKAQPELDEALFRLGRAAALLSEAPREHERLVELSSAYLGALGATGLPFSVVARENIRKTRGAFLEPEPGSLPDFDAKFPAEEQLPHQFEIRVNQRVSGRSYLRWNNVFIGDPLTDSIGDPDGYRFHDVFHFAHAAILHWSPVMRALIRHKRKSQSKFDESEDSGRAIVVEEGLSAWIFSKAKDLDFFAGHDRVSLAILKTIEDFVRGYEVEACPQKLWERAILDGFTVFRQLRDAKGGWVVGNRATRSIRFEPLTWKT